MSNTTTMLPLAYSTTMGKSPTVDTTITYKEFVGAVEILSGQEQFYSYRCCPTDTDSFPWLSKIALQFEEYSFENLAYYYVPKCPTTLSGGISLGFDPDPMDPAPTTLNNILSCENKLDLAIFTPGKLNLGKKVTKVGQNLYIRQPLDFSGDLRITDLGRLNVYVSAGTANVTVGHLYVEYTIKLKIPQLAKEEGQAVDTFQRNDSGKFTWTHVKGPNYIKSVVLEAADKIRVVMNEANNYQQIIDLATSVNQISSLAVSGVVGETISTVARSYDTTNWSILNVLNITNITDLANNAYAMTSSKNIANSDVFTFYTDTTI